MSCCSPYGNALIIQVVNMEAVPGVTDESGVSLAAENLQVHTGATLFCGRNNRRLPAHALVLWLWLCAVDMTCAAAVL